MNSKSNTNPKPKTVMDAMKINTIETFRNLVLFLLSQETFSQKREDGSVEEGVRVIAEVAKGKASGPFARMRVSVKVLDGTIKVEEDLLENSDYTVMFKNLSISYIDGKGNVYFKADDYEVEED